jgi:hypothetical protein
MQITLSGTLGSAVANLSTFTVTIPAAESIRDSGANFPFTAGLFHSARGHRLIIGKAANEYREISGFTVALTNQNTLTVTNRTGVTLPAGSEYKLLMNFKGERFYQANDPAFARKMIPAVAAPMFIVNLGMPATASATALVASVTDKTTSAAGKEKLTANICPDVPRAISITSNNAADTASFTCLVSGLDVHGQAMSELLAFSGAATTTGNKAFACICSIKMIHASGTALTGTISVGTSTKLGLPAFVPSAGYVMKELQDGISATAGTFAYGITTAGGSTTTTGDVRGTYIPNTVPDGAKTYELLLCLPDPGNIGIAQA